MTFPKSVGNGSGMVGVAEMGPETAPGRLETEFWPPYLDFTRVSPEFDFASETRFPGFWRAKWPRGGLGMPCTIARMMLRTC